MTTRDLIPVDALDPEAVRREWIRAYEYHLDHVPPLIEAIVVETLPSIRASRVDQEKVTGGGYVDSVPTLSLDTHAATDARELWGLIVEYVDAVAEWLGLEHPRLSVKPNPDPLLAHTQMGTVVEWLVEHADDTRPIHQLDEFREAMFARIRQLRARYGVFTNGRRPKRLCDVCGARQVVDVWVDSTLTGRSVRASRCSACHDVQIGGDTPPAPRVQTEACEQGRHDECTSLHCECEHHEGNRRTA